MADITIRIPVPGRGYILQTWKDQGDGTYAPLNALSGEISATVDAVGIDQSTDGTTNAVSVKTTTGAGATIGAAADAAVVTDAVGTLSSKLRGLVKWAFERMPASLGQKAKAASLPVVIASDQDALAVTGTFFQATQPSSDAGPAWTSAHGVAGVPFTSADAQTAAAVTNAPSSGQKLVITDLMFSNRSAATLEFTFVEETSGTVITGPFSLGAGMSAQLTPRSKAWKLPTANKKLMVDVSAAGNVTVDAHYFSEA